MRKILPLIFFTGFITSAFAAIPKGDGIIIDDVSSDITCSADTCVSTFITDKPDLGHLTYIFPDIAYINRPATTKDGITSIQKTCPVGTNKPPMQLITYISYPEFKADLLGGQKTGLGECIAGADVTKTYKANNPNTRVMPMISGSAYLINTSTDTQIIQTAKTIANAINADPNAAGVSFDLEGPSLGKGDSVKAQVAIAKGFLFLNTLSAALGDKKFIAVFDAGALLNAAKASSSTNQWPANAFVLHALYDSGECNKTGTPYEPCSVEDYVEHGANAKGFMVLNPKIPVMFVLPAAATTQLYESIQDFNTNFSKIHNILSPEFLAKFGNDNCQVTADQMNLFIANDFLAAPDNAVETLERWTSKPTIPAQDFYKACRAYTNTGVDQSQYMTAALTKVDAVKADSNYIGVGLYNLKPGQPDDSFYLTTCAKRYYNNYYGDTKLYGQCVGFYPETITPGVWDVYNGWKSQEVDER
tara:strand:- start:14373 stop:15794 length:1422 start_codon:yes stop_codon:yes gene_type:complete